MHVQNISLQDRYESKLAFRAGFVTLSEKNFGHEISNHVINPFNKKILPALRKACAKEVQAVIDASGAGRVISKPKDYQNKVNFFALAGGSGSRFRELAQAVGSYNKISLPLKIDKNTSIHMLDFAMSLGKFFMGKEGVNKIMLDQSKGSFDGVIAYYKAGNPIKDTVVCCGDNVYDGSVAEMMEFFTRSINNPDKHLALIGVMKTPQEVANRFGVLQTGENLGGTVLKLTGFREKPSVEEAMAMAVGGKNVANRGMFYISKEAMEKLMAEIDSGVNNIKKNDAELYDFANAISYIHGKLPEWFGIKSMEGADVKIVDKWEDVGEPQAFYRFLDDIKQGQYVSNFHQKLASKIKKAFRKRVHIDDPIPYIIFANSTKVTRRRISNSKKVAGVHIVI